MILRMIVSCEGDVEGSLLIASVRMEINSMSLSVRVVVGSLS